MPSTFNAAEWLVDRVAAERGTHTAVETPSHNLTYDELVDLTGRVAAALRSLGLRRDDRVGHPCASAGSDGQEHLVQPAQRGPVGAAGVTTGAVHGLDRGLDLEAAELAEGVTGAQVLLAARDEIGVPQPGVLFGEGDEAAAGGQPRGGERHEGG